MKKFKVVLLQNYPATVHAPESNPKSFTVEAANIAPFARGIAFLDSDGKPIAFFSNVESITESEKD